MTDLLQRLEKAQILTKEVGEILLQIAATKSVSLSYKADNSIVTEADITADRYIYSAIHKNFPNDLILSEESNPSHPIGQGFKDNYLWIIDPLDGTTNFSLDLPFWGVSIACLKNGEPVVAAINFPVLNELYTASKGSGAFINNHPITLVDFHSRSKLSYFAACSRTYQQYQISIPYKVRILGSTCYDLCSIAKGTSILGFEATPKIWDIAAGWLIVLEAGKAIDTLNRRPLFPLSEDTDYSTTIFPTIAGESSKIIAMAREKIIPLHT